MKVVQWDLKNNSFLQFHRNDAPLTLQKSRKKREKKELLEFVESLPQETAERKRKIKEFVLSKSKSKEESGKLVLKITTMLKEKILQRVDSKIDLTEIFRHDYYQTAQEFVLVFYAKNVEEIQVVFVDSVRVWIWINKERKVILEFSGEISGEQESEISRMNFKIKFKKQSAENLSISLIQEISGITKETPEESTKETTKEFEKEITKETPEESKKETTKEIKTEKLVPEYVKSLKEITEFNPLENVCGILNPGIDCYIISIVQCLFSINSLVNLLAMGRFVSEININNPLSRSKGKMAISLANVLTRMLDQKKPFVLTFLKRSVAEFWGLYDPYQQQDAEEILNFFLDSLHEELNNAPRVKYTPKEDLPDRELAEEFNKSHTSLNQSVIADTFQGFYKSKLSCPKCGQESRKFDPFMNLSIEVPAPPTFLEVLVIDSVVDLSKRRISIPIQESFLMVDIYKGILARLENPANVDIIGVVIENLKITHILDKEKPLLNYSDSLENIVYYLVVKNMPYVVVEHSLFDNDTSTAEYFGIPFITSVDCIGECDLKRIRDQMMCILTKSIVKHPLNATDLFDVVFRVETGDQDTIYDLQPNSIIQVKLLWKSKKIKEFYYEEEKDFYVITDKERQDTKQFTLNDCLDHFFKEEKIEWRCEKCKDNVEAIKKLDLWSSPDILIIHLKRFAFDMKYQRWIKHDTLIDYPVSDFDLSPFRIGPDQGDLYDLIAVSNHMGSMNRGHYTTFGKRGSKWYHFDDDVVMEVKQDDLVGRSGYILFYQRKVQ